MKAHECYHCRQWIEEGVAHDCWTTTESALTADLSDELQEAWERIRETVVEFGEQRIYASGTAIMFSKSVCYAFVRPRRSFLELWIFLRRPLKSPLVRRSESNSFKHAHKVQIRHRDEVEAPITAWLREAYDVVDLPRPKAVGKRSAKAGSPARRAGAGVKKKPAAATKRRR
jgi:hypothetical protein